MPWPFDVLGQLLTQAGLCSTLVNSSKRPKMSAAQ